MQNDNSSLLQEKLQYIQSDAWTYFMAVMTPSIVKVIEFAKCIPGFLMVKV